MDLSNNEKRVMKKLINDPIYFFEHVMGYKRHPIIKKYRGTHWSKWTADMFGTCEKQEVLTVNGEEIFNDWTFPSFRIGEMITWQQLQVLSAIKEECAKTDNPTISLSVASGRGTGKSFLVGGLMFWSMVRKEQTQGAITAPSITQLQDASWARLGQILRRSEEFSPLGKKLSGLFKKTTERFQMKSSEDTWFISAKVGRKETPEALAGLHSQSFVFLAADESSAIPDEIFNTAEDGLTDPSYLFLLTSNYTRLNGFFHDSFKSNSEFWINISLNGEESPLVKKSRAIQTLTLNGRNSYKYRVQVLGKAPEEGIADKDGWIPLFMEDELRAALTKQIPKPFVCGVDPSGQGQDKTSHVIRDSFILQKIRTSNSDTPKSIANAIVAHQNIYDIPWEDFIVDNFGSEELTKEVALAVPNADVTGVHWGRDRDFDKTKHLNVKARCFMELQRFIKMGGKLYGEYSDWNDLLDVKFSTDNGIFKIMSKEEMRKRGIKSPNDADAAALTFYKSDYDRIEDKESKIKNRRIQKRKLNIFQ